MILHLLHALPGCLVIGMMVFAAAVSRPDATRDEKLKAANRRLM